MNPISTIFVVKLTALKCCDYYKNKSTQGRKLTLKMAINRCFLGLFALLCVLKSIHSQSSTACAGVANGMFVRNSESCRAYYYCLNGKAHSNNCPENYLFEPMRQICGVASQVECTGCSPFGLQNIAHPTDCSSYFQCVSGIRSVRSCGQNSLFDRSIGDCNAATSVICVRDESAVCSSYGGYVKIGDPADCSKYFTCLFGVAYRQTCAPGLFFKPTIASCTFPEDFDFCQA